MMEKIPVKFNDAEDVSHFVNVLAKYDSDFDLYCGNYCVDAKSVLGILTMDLRNHMFVSGNCEEQDRTKILHELQQFVPAN
jgi:phosphocarrier protein HPr